MQKEKKIVGEFHVIIALYAKIIFFSPNYIAI